MISFKEFLDEKRGLWDNIHAKQKRIKNGSGEHMRKPGSKGAPTAADFKASEATSKNEEVELQEADTKIKNVHHNGEHIGETGIDSEASPGNGKWFAKHYKSKMNSVGFDSRKEAEAEVRAAHGIKEEVELTEGAADKLGDKIDNAESSEHAKSIISKAPTKHLQYLHHWNMGLSGGRTHKDMPHIKAELTKRKSLLSSAESSKRFDEELEEDAKGYKNPTGGLTQKGRDHYNRETGGHLKAPVTTPPSELKKGSKAANRRKSFCARMSGVKGPMKKPNGEPSRKALALRKWNC